MTGHRNSMDELARNGFRFLPHICFLCVFSFSNFVFAMVVRKIDSAVVGSLSLGALASQFGLLVIWSVFGRMVSWKRLLVSLVVGLLLCESFMLGATLQGEGLAHLVDELLERQQDVLTIPLVFAFAQLPCWLAKVIFGWNVCTSHDVSSESPIRIRHLMIATAAIALLITLARWGLPGDRLEYWSILGILCAVSFGFGLMLLVPIMWATLKAKHPVPSTVAVICYLLSLGVALSFVLWILSGGAFFDIVTVVVLSVSGATAVMVIGLATARSYGYCLVGRSERIRATPKLQMQITHDLAEQVDGSQNTAHKSDD
jgi:hypothetical protein